MYETPEGSGYPTTGRGPSLFVVAVVALVFGAVGGIGGLVVAARMNAAGRIDLPSMLGLTPVVDTIAGEPPVRTGGANGLPEFAAVASRVNASVVNINTLSVEQNPFDLFFGGGGSQVVHGLGTGVIVDAQGYILTNYHVVENANDIRVTVIQGSSKQEYKGTMVGGDKLEDLAVVKINATGLKAVKFGNSDQLQAGEWVMAIGNPFGFEHTVSVGVVSALNRSLPVSDGQNMKGLIQTDASINPGNSGGPLVNLKGEVVGINSAIYVGNSNGPQASGLGFSIPSNRAQEVLKQLRANKKVEHPWIGIKYSPIDDKLSQDQHLPVSQGIVVSEVIAGSPAEKAKLHIGDVATAVDGNSLADQQALSTYVSKQKVGAVVTLDIQRFQNRRWEPIQVKVRLEDMPADAGQTTPQSAPPPQPDATPRGRSFQFPFNF
jgi:serine protease Do